MQPFKPVKDKTYIISPYNSIQNPRQYLLWYHNINVVSIYCSALEKILRGNGFYLVWPPHHMESAPNIRVGCMQSSTSCVSNQTLHGDKTELKSKGRCEMPTVQSPGRDWRAQPTYRQEAYVMRLNQKTSQCSSGFCFFENSLSLCSSNDGNLPPEQRETYIYFFAYLWIKVIHYLLVT